MSLLIAALLAGAGAPAPADLRPPVEYFRREGSRAPFSAAVRVGDSLYLSGMIGGLPDGTLPEGIEAQTRAMMENIRSSLALAGRGFGDVVRCLVMLEDMDDWPVFNRIYLEYFDPARLPARSAFGSNGLALGALVEMECQAHAPAEGNGE